MTYLTDKSANIRKTANLRRKLFPDLKSATNFASNKPKLFLRVSSPLRRLLLKHLDRSLRSPFRVSLSADIFDEEKYTTVSSA